MSVTPDTLFADALQELCEESNLPAATVVGLMMYQIGMINERAKERQEEPQPATRFRPDSIPEGWVELQAGQPRKKGDRWWQFGEGPWRDISTDWIGRPYLSLVAESMTIRKIK